MKPNHEELETILKSAILEAGHMIRENAMKINSFEWKKKDDPVTEIDRRAETMIRQHIESKMNANFMGEEFGEVWNNALYTFLVDPIDGTKSFMSHEFNCSSSIGVEFEGKLIAGAVYDFMRDLLYIAVDDRAYMEQDGKKHPIQQAPKFDKIVVSITDAPTMVQHAFREQKREDGEKRFRVISRSGSIALSLAQLSHRTVDAFIQFKGTGGHYHAWDVAGGAYIAQACGIQLQLMDGKPFNYREDMHAFMGAHPDCEKVVIETFREALGK